MRTNGPESNAERVISILGKEITLNPIDNSPERLAAIRHRIDEVMDRMMAKHQDGLGPSGTPKIRFTDPPPPSPETT